MTYLDAIFRYNSDTMSVTIIQTCVGKFTNFNKSSSFRLREL